MAKLAGRDYPGDLDPEEAKKWMDVLVNNFGGRAESKEAFAQEVGHKSTSSGTFIRKIADARKYGIIAPRGDYKATQLGTDLANPRNSQHEDELTLKMLRNISLLSDLHDTLDGSFPPELWRVLTEITDANPKEAKKAEEWLEHLYESMVDAEGNLEKLADSTDEKNDQEETKSDSRDNVRAESSQLVQSTPDFEIYVKAGNDEIRFEQMTDINIELARQFLKSKKESPNPNESNQF